MLPRSEGIEETGKANPGRVQELSNRKHKNEHLRRIQEEKDDKNISCAISHLVSYSPIREDLTASNLSTRLPNGQAEVPVTGEI